MPKQTAKAVALYGVLIASVYLDIRTRASEVNGTGKSMFQTGLVQKMEFRTQTSLNPLPKDGSEICLLTEEQIRTILDEGEGGERFETEEAIRQQFTFEVIRYRGSVKGVHERPGMVWMVLVRDRTDDKGLLSEDSQLDARFVTMQLVRFGVVAKKRLGESAQTIGYARIT